MKILSLSLYYLAVLVACVPIPKNSQKKECDASVLKIIDSLKIVIYSDTAKFLESEINQFGTLGLRNKNPYSPIYVVDGKYFYKLDIIPSDSVKRFVNEIFSADKVKSINFPKDSLARALYGVHGEIGAILIQMKNKDSFNPLIGGLKLKNKKMGANF